MGNRDAVEEPTAAELAVLRASRADVVARPHALSPRDHTESPG
jgi:hypothetical protein